MAMTQEQIEFVRAHGITKCPPGPEGLGFGMRDWGIGRDAEAEYRGQHLRWHGDPVRRHYWELARFGGWENGKAKSENRMWH